MSKFTKFIVVILFATSFQSCEFDLANPEERLAGTWSAVSFSIEYEENTKVGELIENSFSSSLSADDLSYEITFEEDDRFSVNGDYSLDIATSSGPSSFELYSGLLWDGQYSIENDTILMDNVLFQFDIEGRDLSTFNKNQVFKYDFRSRNKLVFTYERLVETDILGIVTSKYVKSESVWKRNQ